MEDKNYYVPNVEDIHLNYQYEFRPWDWKNNRFLDEWKPGKYMKEKSLHKLQDKYIATGNLRTPWLTKEAIESCGWEWKRDGIMRVPEGIVYEKGNYWMFHHEKNKWITITAIDPAKKEEETDWMYNCYNGPVYNGKCPSINELRIIEKLIGVIK